MSCLLSTCHSSLQVHILIICFHEGLSSVRQIFYVTVRPDRLLCQTDGRLSSHRQRDHVLGPVAVRRQPEGFRQESKSLVTEPDLQVRKQPAGWSYLSAPVLSRRRLKTKRANTPHAEHTVNLEPSENTLTTGRRLKQQGLWSGGGMTVPQWLRRINV